MATSVTNPSVACSPWVLLTAPASLYVNTTSSVLVKTGDGFLSGIYVATVSGSPTIKLWDSLTAAAPVIINTFTPVANTFYPIPARFATGLFITIGATLDCTVFYS